MESRFHVVLRTPGPSRWRRFRRPLRTVSARSVSEVVPALEQIQAALDGGLHAAGFIAYEAAQAFGLPTRERTAPGWPVLCFGLFDRGGVDGLDDLPPPQQHALGSWSPDISRAAYLAAVSRIKAYIEAGDTYQINFTFRLLASFRGDPLGVLHDLIAGQQGDWSAYVDTGSHAVASASPELLFARDGDRFECRPMKGTAPRGRHPAEDLSRARALRASEKNRAENVMIVDMVRNDLGRLARIGSVEVRSLFDVERYPRQWQMTSTVAAQAPGARLPGIVDAMFPSGSVTGAPKRRSMEIIRELEASPRGVYTGAIGWLSPEGTGHFNVAIRTVAVDRARGIAEFGVGSGIVWDSDAGDEYDECLLKASILGRRDEPFQLLETMGWQPGRGFALLERHLDRMAASAEYFGFRFDAAGARGALAAALGSRETAAKVRLLCHADGRLDVQVHELPAAPRTALRAALAGAPVDPDDVFLFHKTTRRGVYERARAARPGVDAVLLWNPDGELTESTEANVVVEIHGRRITPPVSAGLLAGTLRAELLARGAIAEGRVDLRELRAARRLWLINSVRGWMDAELVD